MEKKIIKIITSSADECYNIPNDYYLLIKNPGKHILQKLRDKGYEIIKKEEKEEIDV